jgi:phage terminase large subunit-like protein
MDKAKYGDGAVKLFYETPIGMESVDARRRMIEALRGVTKPHEHDAKGSKEFRAEGPQIEMEVGNVRFVRGPWLLGYTDQMLAFPQGKLKDMVDGTSGAFEVLSKKALAEYNLSGTR